MEIPNRKKILCLDDDLDIQQAYPRIFLEVAEIVVCADGQEGLRTYEANPSLYGLIFTDNDMPVMNGIDFLKAIKGRTDVPRVMYSAPGTLEKMYQELVRAHGGLGLIVKPAENGLLPTVARELLETGRSPRLEEYFTKRYGK